MALVVVCFVSISFVFFPPLFYKVVGEDERVRLLIAPLLPLNRSSLRALGGETERNRRNIPQWSNR